MHTKFVIQAMYIEYILSHTVIPNLLCYQDVNIIACHAIIHGNAQLEISYVLIFSLPLWTAGTLFMARP